ncbi:formylglycine-generating enzyme family protein [Pontibacter liquoris]|uniref:formylglycine-generating enzyme family protein n=1 Tax=Pontibacter liquoris TaxID=2905677 RepID=UPI001FA7DE4A|nr:formylglycine-generating enzyme family protein [Pontibacter liquoris]
MNRLLLFLLLLCCQPLLAQKSTTRQMAPVASGTFVPLYGAAKDRVPVKGFLLDKYPVTNAEFLAFVKQQPKWQKSAVKKVFADQNYLRHWASDQSIGPDAAKLNNSPVINVSWFAAKAYCECQGKRLPTVNEWEYAALASETKRDATNDEAFYQRSLEWYSQPNPKYLPAVQSSFRNYYGVYGMIGLVWEWTSDFNSAMLQSDARAGNSNDQQQFCGAGASNATNVKNYVAFMRYAFRSSLKPSYTVGNLGFRCAQSSKVELARR